MSREQSLIEILSTAQTAGIDAAIAAIDRENASLSRFSATAGSVNVDRLSQSSASAVQSLSAVGEEAGKTGAALEQLSSDPTRILIVGETEQAQMAIAQVEADLDRVEDVTRVVVDADNSSAMSALASTESKLQEIQQPVVIPVDANVSSAQSAVGGLQSSLNGLGSSGGVAGRALAGLGGAAMASSSGVQGLASSAVGMTSTLGPAGIAIAGAAVAIGAVGAASLGAAGEMERYETQLGVLLGSTERAQERIAELVEFAAKTPFEIPEVVRASKVLQTFGGDLLATGESLRFVGDVAAGTGTPFEEMALLLGRIKTSLESGLVPSEQIMRLQAMGALTVDGRQKIMDFAEAVRNGTADGAEGFALLQDQMSIFSGMMVAQSATFEGKMSNLADAIGGVFRSIGKLLLPAAKAFVDILIPIVNGVSKFIDGLSGTTKATGPLNTIMNNAVRIWSSLFGIVGDLVGWLGPRLAPAFTIVGTAVNAVVTVWATLSDAFMWFIDTIAPAVGTVMGAIGSAFDTFQRTIGDLAATVIGVVATVAEAAAAIPGPWQEGATAVATTLNAMKTEVDAWGESTVARLAATGQDGPAVLGAELASGADVVQAGAESMSDPIAGAVQGAQDDAKAIARATPGEIAKSLAEGRATVTQAGSVLADAITNAVDPAKERARIIGVLTGNAIGDGLTSTNAATRAAAQKQYDALVKDLDDPNLSPAARWAKEGLKMGADLAVALNSTNPEVYAAGDYVKTTLEERLFALEKGVPQIAVDTGTAYADALDSTKEDVKRAADLVNQRARLGWPDATVNSWGRNVGEEFADGLESAKESIRIAALRALAWGAAAFRGASPPKIGPFHLIDKYGENIIEQFAIGMERRSPWLRDRAIKMLEDAGAAFRIDDWLIGDNNVPVRIGGPKPATPTGGGTAGGYAGTVSNAYFNVAGSYITIETVEVNLPSTWRGTPQDTQDLAESLARDIRLQTVAYATSGVG